MFSKAADVAMTWQACELAITVRVVLPLKPKVHTLGRLLKRMQVEILSWPGIESSRAQNRLLMHRTASNIGSCTSR